MTRIVDEFRRPFNTVRPHEALHGARPIERYLADPNQLTSATAPTRQDAQIP